MRQKSKNLFERSKKIIPGGVNSPARAFKSVGGNPIFMESAKGAFLYDVEGNKYIDYINSWGPMILGHAHAQVVEAIHKQAEKSSSFGAPTVLEAEMAEQVIKMVPGLELIRMVNSGTEACMSAIRLARGYTGKNKIIKFSGCYHGHHDSFLVKAGSGLMTAGLADSKGVSAEVASQTLIANFNDLESVKSVLNNNLDEIAALIIEPVAGNMGCIPPSLGFLQEVRQLCVEHKVVFILDEVMTGFRLAKGGAQELYHVEADVVCFGKIIGGGLPVGAFGGKKEIFDHLAPNGPVYQAGTLSGNPLAMTAGLTTLKILESQPNVYENIEKNTTNLKQGLTELLTKKSVPHQINHIGSMMSIFFTDEAVTDYDSAKRTDTEFFSKLFWGMIEKGVYLPPSNFESWFVSNCHKEEIIVQTLESAKSVIKSI